MFLFLPRTDTKQSRHFLLIIPGQLPFLSDVLVDQKDLAGVMEAQNKIWCISEKKCARAIASHPHPPWRRSVAPLPFQGESYSPFCLRAAPCSQSLVPTNHTLKFEHETWAKLEQSRPSRLVPTLVSSTSVL